MAEWLGLVVFRNKVRKKDGELKDEFKGIPIDYFYDEDEIYDAMESGYIPAFAEELGIDPNAEIYDIVSLIQHEDLGIQGIRAWDEEGKAWHISAYENDYIWERAPQWDKAPEKKKRKRKNKG